MPILSIIFKLLDFEKFNQSYLNIYVCKYGIITPKLNCSNKFLINITNLMFNKLQSFKLVVSYLYNHHNLQHAGLSHQS